VNLLLFLVIGLVLAVFGLVLALVEDPDQVALAAAVRRRTGELREGDVVRVDGVLRADETLTAPLGEDCVVYRVDVLEGPAGPDRRRAFVPTVLHRFDGAARGLAVVDPEGEVLVDTEHAELRGSTRVLRARWRVAKKDLPSAIAALPDELRARMEDVRSLLLRAGDRVAVCGVVSRRDGRFVIGGPGSVLSNESDEDRARRRRKQQWLGAALVTGGLALAAAMGWALVVG
jgi:hypothetical protein